MWITAKHICLIGVLCTTSACASMFSSHDSSFSCKNADHGGCEHPMVAYEKALQQKTSLGGVEAKGLASDSVSDNGVSQGINSSFRDYKGAVYAELESLLQAPNTPLVVPAKTIRTLILPHTDGRAKNQRLFMSRFIFTVVEEARFVLGGMQAHAKSRPFIDSLVSSSKSGPQTRQPINPNRQQKED